MFFVTCNIILSFRKRYLVTLVKVSWKMHGMDIIVHSLLMDKLALENPTPWLDMVLIKASSF